MENDGNISLGFWVPNPRPKGIPTKFAHLHHPVFGDLIYIIF
jgi:hypothetical protein